MNIIKEKHTDTEWKVILEHYDELVVLSHPQQLSKISKLALSQELRDTLINLLDNTNNDCFLDKSIDEISNKLLNEGVINDLSNPDDIIGREFGPWKVIRELAKGGMGHVYLAQRNDGQFEKQVALKIIKSGAFSAQTQEKFIYEMRTLAKLEHANIARLLDGGLNQDGISYFVMELIEGTSISTYVNAQCYSLNQRIKLIIQLCEAVEFAHQNLIIHGDIKPTNVLVDEQGHIKLVDFGISQPLSEIEQRAFLPRFTPGYSSPEQAKGHTLSTASDVFGICAVLYELCCGFAPRSGSQTTSLSEYNKQMDTEIVSVFIRFKKSLNESILKGLNFKNLNGALRRELGTIISKGLNVTPSKRYKNSTELSNDLNKFISNQAIDTYSIAKSYQLKKSFIRNKLTYAVSLFGFIGISIVALLALSQAQIAKAEAKKANWANDFVLGIFDKADPVKNQQNPITADKLAQFAADNLINENSDYTPEIKLKALELLGTIQLKLGSIESTVKIHLERIKILEIQHVDKLVLASAHNDLSLVYSKLVNYSRALDHAEIAISLVSLNDAFSYDSCMFYQTYIYTLIRLNRIEEAQIGINRLLSRENDILKFDEPFELLTQIYGEQALIYDKKNDYPAAITAIEKAKYYVSKLTDLPLLNAQTLNIESDIYSDSGEIEKAINITEHSIEIYTQELGLSHPETLNVISNQASNYGRLGNNEKSIEISLELIKIQLENNYPDSLMVIPFNNIAHKYRKIGKCHEALKFFSQAKVIWGTLETKMPTGEMSTLSGMARCFITLEQYTKSEDYFNRALTIIKDNLGVEHAIYPRLQLQTVELYLKQNNYKKILEILPKIYNQLVNIYGEDSSWVAIALLKWAQLHEHLGDIKSAKEKALKALPLFKNAKPASNFISELDEVLRITNL